MMRLLAPVLVLTAMVFLALLCIDAVAQCEQPVPNTDWKLVHTQAPRHTTEICNSETGECISDASYAERVPDVGGPHKMGEFDVVVDDLKGNTKVIHNCSGDDAVICSAQEARVSPNGRYIAYAVSYPATQNNSEKRAVRPAGTWMSTGDWQAWRTHANDQGVFITDPHDGTVYPLNWYFKEARARIFIYDIQLGQRYPVSDGHIDRMPSWWADDGLLVATNRDGHYAPLTYHGTQPYPDPTFKVWRFRVDFEGRRLIEGQNVTPHSYSEMTPLALSTGHIMWGAYHGVWPADHGSTPQNEWWLEFSDINGNDVAMELGAHGSGVIRGAEHTHEWVDPNRVSQRDSQFLALLPPAQISATDGAVKLCTGSYYRGPNHLGRNGTIYCWTFTPQYEGALLASSIPEYVHRSDELGSGQFVVNDIFDATPGSMAQDQPVRFHKDGRAAGKSGYPSHWFGDKWAFTRSRGGCFFNWWPHIPKKTGALGGEPLCKRQINVAHVDQVKNPFDEAQTECVGNTCDMGINAWDGQPIGTYEEFFGVPEPQVAEIKDAEQCFLQSVNARAGVIVPVPGKTSEKDRVATQGNAVEDWQNRVTHIAVTPFEHWPGPPDRLGWYRRQAPILGDIESDGSMRVEVPCRTPFHHCGWDAEVGACITGPVNPMSVNGTTTCHGCHLGHSKYMSDILGIPSVRFRETEAYRRATQ